MRVPLLVLDPAAAGLVLLVLPMLAARQASQTQPVSGARVLGDLRGYEAPPAPPPAQPMSGGCGGGGSPVENLYLHSGELYLEAVDVRIPGRGLDFVWARKYRSRLGPSTGLGNGWDFSYNVWIEWDGPQIRLHDGNTRSDLYSLRPDGGYVAVQFLREGRFNPDGTFTLTFADTGKWILRALDGSPAAGRIDRIVDRNGNTIQCLYDGAGKLVIVIDTLSRAVTISHDQGGRIVAVTDFAGRSVVYAHYQAGDAGGSAGDLASVRSPLVVGTGHNDFPSGKTTTYTYSKGFSDERLNHNLLSVTDPKGQTWLQATYAAATSPASLLFDRLVKLVRGDPTDSFEIVYVPTGAQAVGSAAQGVLRVIVNDPVGNVGEHFFDRRGRRVRERLFTGRAPDPDLPTTPSSNRPVNPLRPDDPPYFETSWKHDADSLVTETVHPNGNVTRRVYELELDPNAPWRSRGNLRELRRLPGSHTPVGDQSEIVELFEYESGLGGCCGTNFVKKHTDPRGNVTQHVHDAFGNRLQTIHPLPGVVEDFTYDPFGQMSSHTLPDRGDGYRRRDDYHYYATGSQTGYLEKVVVDAATLALTTRHEYDLVGNKVREIDPLQHDWQHVVNALNQAVLERSPEVTPGGARCERLLYYDANDNLVREDVENRDENGVLQSNSHFTTIHELEVLNHVVRTCRESGSFAVPQGQLGCAGLPQSEFAVEELAYDPNRNRILRRKGQATSGGDPFNTVSWAWDERDMLFQEIRAAGSSLQSTAQHDYDGNGSEKALREGLEGGAHVTTRVFDAYDRKVSETDAMGNVTEHHYDPSGNLGGQASPGVPNPFGTRILGELVDVPGPAGNVRLYESNSIWDALNRKLAELVEHFDPLTQAPIGDGQSVATFVWNPASLLQARIDDHGHAVETISYDTAYRRESVVDAVTNTTIIGYDLDSRIVSWTQTEKSSLGGDVTFVTTWTWDGLHRWTSTTDNVGTTQAHKHDSRSNVVETLDGKGNVTRAEFDGLDRLTEQRRVLTDTGAGGGTLIGEIATTQAWDDSSRLSSRTDDAGHTTQYVHDSLDRRTATLLADCTQHQVLSYDAHDVPLVTRDANGTTLTQSFDQLDRMVTRQIQVVPCQPPPGPCVSPDPAFENFAYDGLSRLVHASDSDALVDFGYDSLSQKVRETLNGRTTTCSFDGGGRRLSCTYPGGRQLDYAHDALDRVTGISDAGGIIASFGYVGPVRVERRTCGSTISDFSYDGVLPNPPGDSGERQVVRTRHYRLSGQQQVILDDRTYTWDRMDNWTQRRNVHPSGPGLTHAYTLDSAYRPVRTLVTDPVGSLVRDVNYAHDDVGNRTSVSGDDCPGAYSCDGTPCEPADCQVHQYTQTPCSSRLYDPNGNLVQALVNLQSPVIGHYDYANRLVEAFVSLNGQTHQYRHDPLGRRIAKVVDAGGAAVETRFFYLDGDVIEEQDAAGATEATYVWDDRGPVQMVRSGAAYCFLEDAMGSVMAVTNSSGFCVERYDYADYGLPGFFGPSWTPLPGSLIQNPLLFHGWRWDDELRLYYATVNFDPLAGRPIVRGWSDPGAAGTGSFLTDFENLWARMGFQAFLRPTFGLGFAAIEAQRRSSDAGSAPDTIPWWDKFTIDVMPPPRYDFRVPTIAAKTQCRGTSIVTTVTWTMRPDAPWHYFKASTDQYISSTASTGQYISHGWDPPKPLMGWERARKTECRAKCRKLSCDDVGPGWGCWSRSEEDVGPTKDYPIPEWGHVVTGKVRCNCDCYPPQ